MPAPTAPLHRRGGARGAVRSGMGGRGLLTTEADDHGGQPVQRVGSTEGGGADVYNQTAPDPQRQQERRREATLAHVCS